MTSVHLEDATAAAVEAEAARAGLTVDAYVRRLQLRDSVAQHAQWAAAYPEILENEAQEAEAARDDDA